MTDADATVTASKPQADDSPTDWGSVVARAALVLTRVLQGTFTAFGVVFVIGGFSMNIIQFAVLGIFALVLFALVGILELVARGLKGWA